MSQRHTRCAGARQCYYLFYHKTIMTTHFITTTLISLFCHQAMAQKSLHTFIAPSDSNIIYTGRIERTNPNRPTFTYPGVEIRTAFIGNNISMAAKPHSGYFMAQIDDNAPFKIAFLTDSIATICQGSDTTATHQLVITYISEGYQTRPEFRGFILGRGTTITQPAGLPKRRIEFIGNSITCGYGIEANNPTDPYTEATANFYYTYAAQTARNLHAQATVVARSGIGVYRNYNGPQTGDAVNMNTEYPYTLLYDDTHLWDFTRFTPDVVCINLGTNDTSTTGADSTLLFKGFCKLYTQVRSHYPQTKILLLSGCMMKGEQLAMTQQAMDATQQFALSQGDTQVYRLDFAPHDGTLGYGASWHPSLKQHSVMAEQLTQYLQKIMKWK